MSVFTQEPAFSDILKKAASGQSLSSMEAENAFNIIMEGGAEPVPLAAFLTALHMRGETPDELEGAVRAVRAHMTVLPAAPSESIDVCGTGGDGLGTLNVSTAVAFVLAGLGVPVAKHGNRALSSQSGATDVLEKLGILPIEDLQKQANSLQSNALAFLAAPLHHPAMRHAGPVRKALGFRTIFNLLGPLCNPAQVKRQLVGVFDQSWCEPVSQTLGRLGAECAWAVHGETDEGGSDELTLAGSATIVAWEYGKTLHFTVSPEMAGFPVSPISSIRGGDAEHNSHKLRALLEGEKGSYRDTVLLNAAAALHVAGHGNILETGKICPNSLKKNVALAARSLDDGHALRALQNASMSPTLYTASKNTGLS